MTKRGHGLIRTIGVRISIECSLALLAASLAVVTLLWRDWIELVFRVDPDGGDGSLEWILVAGAFASSVVLASVAGLEWRRRAPRLAAHGSTPGG